MYISLQSLPKICCISALNHESDPAITPFIGLFSSGFRFSFQQSSTVRGRHDLKFLHRFNLFADFSKKYAAQPSTRMHDVFVAKGITQNTQGEVSKKGSHTREHGDDSHYPTVFSFIEVDESNMEVPSVNKTANEVAHEIMEMDEQNKSTDESDNTFISHIKSCGPFSPMKTERQMLEAVAEESSLTGDKFFVYPQKVKADADTEVFLNRSISNMTKTPVVLMKGAFNGWRWKSFTATMRKTELKGDWWSCLIHVPIEAYKIDFVFFDGENIYDNNDGEDFCVPVEEGGMDFLDFEDFLLEEKHKEIQRIAEEEACKKRLAAEGRQIELLNASREEDMIKSKAEIDRRQNDIHQLMKRYPFSINSNICQIEPFEFKESCSISLYYRKDIGPLASSDNIWIHAGHNNWEDGASIVQRIESSERKDGDWWHTSVAAPEGVSTLDWVFANGPLGRATLFDNNFSQDFHIILENYRDELYWRQEENKLYNKLQDERRQKEKSLQAKGERTAQMKAETKKKTLNSFLLSQNNVVHTDPSNVLGGKNVIVYYNPSHTVLDGKSEVWFRYSFNHWSHRRSPFHPQKMVSVENGSHFKATVKVPLDAYIMDFVFSEREDGGIFDNKDGRDYHIPISGGVVKEEPLHIMHIAVEMAPIAKVGGLGDVVTSLSRALKDLNYEVNIILPKYDCINSSNVSDIRFHKSYSWDGNDIKVWHGIVEGLSVYFIDHDKGLFHMGCIYGSQNDTERFGFFSQSALEFLVQSDLRPDIIHCHDWSSAPVAWMLKERYSRTNSLGNARVVFTIHNLEFGSRFIEKAIVSSDKATTVSPTYAREVSGNPIIRPHLSKFQGILNGIDPDIWDPYNDRHIPVPYTSENVADGKRAAKDALQQKLGLRRSDLPLLGIVTRLTHQKGIHLIKHAVFLTLARGGQVVLLGSAPDPRIENEFSNLADQLQSSHDDRVHLRLTYDEPLSHLIYAGSDFVFVPSIFEPCGLTQLIAMRYGSVPVVRRTGGLHDTVFDVEHDRARARGEGLEPNGFSFDGVEPAGVDYALNRAISAWYESVEWLNSLRKCVMEQDWSWNRPSLQYSDLYRAAIG